MTTRTSRSAATGRHPTKVTTSSVSFRPTAEERRILDRLSDDGVIASEALRRGLRLLEQERWVEQARADAARNRDENLNDEPDAW